MTSLKKIPWVSGGLLLVAYALFGWFVATLAPRLTWLSQMTNQFGVDRGFWLFQPSAVAWMTAVSPNSADVLGALAPLTSTSNFIARWFESDTIAFMTLLSATVLVMAVLFWLRIFVYLLILLAAEALTRLDLQLLGLNKWQSFCILTSTSLVGLALGWTVHDWTVTHYLPE